MKSTRRIHLIYLTVIAALFCLGATNAARLLTVIASPADVTGTNPQVRLLHSGMGNTDWEIEAQEDGGDAPNFLEIAVEGTAEGDGPFKIHRDADADLLTLDENGNVAINREMAQSFHELEVFGGLGAGDPQVNIALTPDTDTGPKARLTVSGASTDEFVIGVNESGTGYNLAFGIDLSAPHNAFSIASDGDIAVGIDHSLMDTSADLHLAGGELFLDGDSTFDWRISANNNGLAFAKGIQQPFAISDGSPANSLRIDNGDIGMGIFFPDAALHVFRDDGTAALKVEETSGTTAIRQLMNLQNNGGVRFSLENTSNARQWEFTNDSAGNFNISLVGTGGRELGITPAGQMIVGPGGNPSHIMSPNGNLIIQGSLTEGSSRTIKENFQAVDCDEVLAKVVDMEITTWNYKHDEDEVRHIGPIAEDFREAFELGENNTTIAAMDKDGVALASIQALHKELRQKEARIDQLENRLQAMEQVLQSLTGEDRN